MRRWGRYGAPLLVLGILLAGVTIGRAERVQAGKLRIVVTGALTPHALPRGRPAPVAVSVAGSISTTNSSAPPQLQTLRIELNRHGHLDYEGLPVCPYDRIQPASSARALAACRSSLVGKGSFSANIVLSGQEPYRSQGKLLVFNGRRHGRPVLLGQIYAPRPFASSFVITFAVRRVARGDYGTVLTASLPKALGGWGYVTGIEMSLRRSFRYRGRAHSYVNAACPAPEGFPGATYPLARVTFDFDGEVALGATLVRDCAVR